MRSRLLAAWSLPTSTPYAWFLDKPSSRRSLLLVVKQPNFPEVAGAANQPFWRLTGAAVTSGRLIGPTLLCFLYAGIALNFSLGYCLSRGVYSLSLERTSGRRAASASPVNSLSSGYDPFWVCKPGKLGLLIAPVEPGAATLGYQLRAAIRRTGERAELCSPRVAPALTHRSGRISATADSGLRGVATLPQSNLSQHSAFSRGLTSQHRRDLESRSGVCLTARYHLYLNARSSLLGPAGVWARAPRERPALTVAAASPMGLSSCMTASHRLPRHLSVYTLQPASTAWAEGCLAR